MSCTIYNKMREALRESEVSLEYRYDFKIFVYLSSRSSYIGLSQKKIYVEWK